MGTCEWLYLRVCISVWLLENYSLLFVEKEDHISLEWLDQITAIPFYFSKHVPEKAPFWSLMGLSGVKQRDSPHDLRGLLIWELLDSYQYEYPSHPSMTSVLKTHSSQPRPKLHIPLRSDTESGYISSLLPPHKGMSYGHAEKNAKEW